MASATILVARMTAMFANSPALPRAGARLPVRDALKSLARTAVAAATALTVMAALFTLRLGLYAATHSGMLAALHLPSHLL
jgi:hypothetical protein